MPLSGLEGRSSWVSEYDRTHLGELHPYVQSYIFGPWQRYGTSANLRFKTTTVKEHGNVFEMLSGEINEPYPYPMEALAWSLLTPHHTAYHQARVVRPAPWLGGAKWEVYAPPCPAMNLTQIFLEIKRVLSLQGVLTFGCHTEYLSTLRETHTTPQTNPRLVSNKGDKHYVWSVQKASFVKNPGSEDL